MQLDEPAAEKTNLWKWGVGTCFLWWDHVVGGNCFVLGVWGRVLGRHISGESIFRRGPAWAKSNFGIRTHLGQSTLRQIQRARSCVLALGPHWGSRESPRKPGSPRKNRESPEKAEF